MASLKQTGNLLDITREVDRNYSLQGYYAASCGNFLPTFGTNYRSNLREVMCSILKLTLEDGTDDFAAEPEITQVDRKLRIQPVVRHVHIFFVYSMLVSPKTPFVKKNIFLMRGI
jgi:hypothetical protein